MSYSSSTLSSGGSGSLSANHTVANAVQLLGRILFAYIFIKAGYGKLMSHDGTVGYIASQGGMPLPPELSYWAAVAIEFGCGILVLIGFLARPAALAMAVFALMTGYFFHYLHIADDAHNLIHWEKNISMAGAAFFIAASGAGGWSLDAKIFGGRG